MFKVREKGLELPESNGVVRVLIWITRLSALFLFSYFALLYLSFAANVEVNPLGVLEYIKAVVFGSFGSLGLYLSTIKTEKKLRQMMVGLCIVFGLIIYSYFSLGKVLWVYNIGIFSHVLAIGVFIWINFWRE